jgi:hypothetical protein
MILQKSFSAAPPLMTLHITIGVFLSLVAATVPVLASDTWIGNSGSQSWSVGGNWSTRAIPVNGDDAIMVGPGATINKTDITFYLNSVQFPSGAPNFHIQVTSAISISGGGVINIRRRAILRCRGQA